MKSHLQLTRDSLWDTLEGDWTPMQLRIINSEFILPVPGTRPLTDKYRVRNIMNERKHILIHHTVNCW